MMKAEAGDKAAEAHPQQAIPPTQKNHIHFSSLT